MTNKLLIGADPEFFLFDTKTKKYVSAHGLVPGTKEKPHKLDNGAVQLDGTAVEFNINPAASAFEFEYNVHSVLGQIRKMIPEHYEFRFEPSVLFDEGYWEEVPKTSKELGCSPDFNANREQTTPANPPQPNNKYPTLRTGAGHIHIGWTEKADPLSISHFWDARQIVLALNARWNSIRRVFDKDERRSTLYGNGPVFRPKSYGVEFRTPSNAWLNYPKLWPWVFDLTTTSFRDLAQKHSSNEDYMLTSILGTVSSVMDKEKKWNTASQAYAKRGIIALPEDWSKSA